MNGESINQTKLAYVLIREYLRNAKLTGGLEKIGFDITDYKLNLLDEIVLLLGKNQLTNEFCDIVETYEEQAVDLSNYDFPKNLEYLAEELIREILEIN